MCLSIAQCISKQNDKKKNYRTFLKIYYCVAYFLSYMYKYLDFGFDH